jgi:hypothetical protein
MDTFPFVAWACILSIWLDLCLFDPHPWLAALIFAAAWVFWFRACRVFCRTGAIILPAAPPPRY